MRTILKNTTRLPWAFVAIAGLLGLAVATGWLRMPSTVGGEVQEEPQREAFLSGAARNERALREIGETLRRIDARLERFERALNEPERSAKPSGANASDANATDANAIHIESGDAAERNK
jgi:hypothetical protein